MDFHGPRMNKAVKICLTEKQLSEDVCVNIPCPVAGCGKIMPHSSALRLHMVKTHGVCQNKNDKMLAMRRKQTPDPVVQIFHCPVQHCVYNINSERSFPKLKYLKQHYMKVHAEKKYVCSDCEADFGLERDLRQHRKICGIVFTCDVCSAKFQARPGLIKHCKAHKHPVPEKYQNKEPAKGSPAAKTLATSPMATSCPATVKSPAINLLTHDATTSAKSRSTNESCHTPSSVSPSVLKTLVTSTAQVAETLQEPVCISRNPSITLKTHINSTVAKTNASSQFSLTPRNPANKVPNQREVKKVTFGPILPAPNMVIFPCAVKDASSIVLKNEPILVSGTGSNYTMQKLYVPIAPKTTNTATVGSGCRFEPTADVGRDACTQTDRQSVTGSSIKSSSVKSNIKSSTRKQSRHSVSIQTNAPKMKRTVAQTQTSGDYILKTAMRSADIPIERESRASQVSPKARLKRDYALVQTSQTQTTNTKPSRKRRRRKSQQDSDIALPGLLTVAAVHEPQAFDLAINSFGELADNQTQTIALLEELEASVAASTSTQTRDSFLSANQSICDIEPTSLPTNQQQFESIETQTNLSMNKDATVDTQVSDLPSDNLSFTRSMATSPAKSHTLGVPLAVDSQALGFNLIPNQNLNNSRPETQSSAPCSSSFNLYPSDMRIIYQSASPQGPIMNTFVPVTSSLVPTGMTSSSFTASTISNSVQQNLVSGTTVVEPANLVTDYIVQNSSGNQPSRQATVQPNLPSDTIITLPDTTVANVPIITKFTVSSSVSSTHFGNSFPADTVDLPRIATSRVDTPSSAGRVVQIVEDLMISGRSSAAAVRETAIASGSKTPTFMTDLLDVATQSSSHDHSTVIPRINSAECETDSARRASHVETQTSTRNVDFPCFFTAGSQTAELDIGYMNTQTQTMDDMFEQLLSNMETQTSDDFLADLGFSNIETQTPLNLETNPNLESAHAQTQTSLVTASTQDFGASTDMETQTLFDSLNFGPNLADSHTQTTLGDLESLFQDIA